MARNGQAVQRREDPSLDGTLVRLQPVAPEQIEWLRCQEIMLGPRWRFGGRTPTPAAYEQLHNTMQCQFLIWRLKDQNPIGYVFLYGEDDLNGQASFAVTRLPQFHPSKRAPLVIYGLGIFYDWVFSCFPYRALHATSAAFNYEEQFAHGEGTWFTRIGTKPDHSWLGDRYHDNILITMSREQWFGEVRQKVVGRMYGRDGTGPLAVFPEDVFIEEFAAEFDYEPESLAASTSLTDELQFGQTQWMQLQAWMDSITGADPLLGEQDTTLGDVRSCLNVAVAGQIVEVQ